jgi:hypothetical protein
MKAVWQTLWRFNVRLIHQAEQYQKVHPAGPPAAVHQRKGQLHYNCPAALQFQDNCGLSPIIKTRAQYGRCRIDIPPRGTENRAAMQRRSCQGAFSTTSPRSHCPLFQHISSPIRR